MHTLLTEHGCLRRQQRLRTAMEEQNWDIFLTGHARTIYYLTGALLAPESPAALLIRRDAGSVFITPAVEALAVDECVPVETYSISRTIADAHADAAKLLKDRTARDVNRRWAVELSHTPSNYVAHLQPASLIDAGATLRSLRKRKEEDEIAEIRRSLEISRVAYETARNTIRPGVSEIEVHSAMLAAATRHAGHTFTFAGDFGCGLRCVRGGGPPTPNIAQSGDLYILDLFPACAFYFGDTCRTFSVGDPSRQQIKAWEVVAGTLEMAETLLRPGVAARDVYAAVRDRLASQSELASSFWHHAGHGVGIHGHEAPRLIPGSEDIIEMGDVIAVEPALYGEGLQGGIRLENTYAVRDSGVERLFDFPLEL
jgi:Xaa-Pro dipeptidase